MIIQDVYCLFDAVVHCDFLLICASYKYTYLLLCYTI